VIALSARPPPRLASQVVAALKKPFDLQQLLRAVNDGCG
jgi:hypothetical protein